MDSGREQNYWPGFVDALSNVVLTLVFVLVIFVFALVMASNKVERKMQEAMQSQADQKTQIEQIDALKQANVQETTQLKQQLAAASEEIKKLQEQIAKITLSNKSVSGGATAETTEKTIAVEDKALPTPKQGTVQIKNTLGNIVLNYPVSITEMDEKSTTELQKTVEAAEHKSGRHKITLRSVIGREPYSVARRLAYYRAISTRNALISKNGESPSDITTMIVQPPQPEDGRVEIVFEKQ